MKVNLDKYSGFADFFLRASEEEKKEVILDAARKSNEEQMKVYMKAKQKSTTPLRK